MKTLSSLLAASAIVLLLAAPGLQAGPLPQFWNRTHAVAKPAPAPAATACNPAGKVCGNCQACAGCAAKPATKAKA